MFSFPLRVPLINPTPFLRYSCAHFLFFLLSLYFFCRTGRRWAYSNWLVTSCFSLPLRFPPPLFSNRYLFCVNMYTAFSFFICFYFIFVELDECERTINIRYFMFSPLIFNPSLLATRHLFCINHVHCFLFVCFYFSFVELGVACTYSVWFATSCLRSLNAPLLPSYPSNTLPASICTRSSPFFYFLLLFQISTSH